MTSPFVRRRRLATELRALREEHGVTAEELAGRLHKSRTMLSKLENAHSRPNLAEIMKILDLLGVTGERWHEIVTIARDAAERGWWDSFGDAMGSRQRLYADIESGATTIRGYNQFGFPGLLQTPEFMRALIRLDHADGPLGYQPARMIQARLKRQEVALRQGGPALEIVLDEFVIRRLAVPAEVMSAQLHHLVGVVSAEPRLSVRILPVDARIEGGFLARSSFTIYTFPDPRDPAMAVADTVNADLVHTDPADVGRYDVMYARLRKASLSPVRSLTLMEEGATRLTELAGS
ncbi:helix-turn-helix domain-containing protein [Actinomadura harenae]|uniref:XRE family transcriptional regulator n=1 Tax=Actinomadura harenae TaxID=2483351 RepID=A0A3M2LUN2_9ACTN|nr:helix-turn-helix transcriptional regulator [Actinomadura harenae]RMI41097.1 XRE family transcriptional regulator [Actinomadura harenae]